MEDAYHLGYPDLMDGYLLWKFAHVLSATILLGTGTGIAFFCWFGSRHALARGDIGTLRIVLRFTVVADAVFTAPAVVFQFLSGAILLERLGWSWQSPWTLTVLGLFAVVGTCWLPVVWIQSRLSLYARAAPSVELLPPGFARLFRVWLVLGVPAFACVVLLVLMMVAKPIAVA